MNKTYAKIGFKNYPDTSTPLSATNLNKIDDALDVVDTRVVTLDGSVTTITQTVNGKASQSEVNALTTKLNTEITERKAETQSIGGSVVTLGRMEEATRRRVDYLWKVSKGIVYDTEKVNATTKEVTVPTGALGVAELQKIGGMSRKGKNLSKTQTLTCGGGQESQFGNTSDLVDLKVGETYTMSFVPSADITFGILISTTSSNALSASANARSSFTFVVRSNYTDYTRILWNNASNSGYTLDNFMVEKSSSATSYEPYSSSLIDAKVEKVVSEKSDGTQLTEVTIPSSVTSLSGYGIGVNASCYNYISPKTYKGMKAVDMGTLNWIKSSNSDNVFFVKSSEFSSCKPAQDNLHCSKYLTVTYSINDVNTMPDKTLKLSHDPTLSTLYVKDTSYTDASAFKSAVNGVILHYEATEGGEDYNAWEYHKKVGSVDLGSLTWELYHDNEYYRTFGVTDCKLPPNDNTAVNGLCQKYEIVAWNPLKESDRAIAVGGVNHSPSQMLVPSVNGVPSGTFDYELATEQIYDITDEFKEDWNLIPVEASGTVSFRYPNDDKYDVSVPSTIKYVVKTSEV